MSLKEPDYDLANLRILTPSRKRLKVGDIFVMQVLDKGYLFGRLIRTDALGGADQVANK